MLSTPGLAPSRTMDIRAPDFHIDGGSFDVKDEGAEFDDSVFDEMVKPEKMEENASLVQPSPALAGTPGFPASAGTAKRPTRKSTLTQQQKNQKRQRATQDQLGTLEVEFNKNPTPNANVRERIAQQINMTERSVQIWFQNRRAKIKNLAKRSIETGEECDAIPESMRRYLAMQALESGNLSASTDWLLNGGLSPYAHGLCVNGDATASKVMIHHLNCRSLTIGTWRRVGQTQLDLVIFYSPTKSMVTYYIQAENTGFRIEYPFSSIKSISLDGGEKSSDAEGGSSEDGSIVIELTRPPLFTMDQGSNGWFQCRDFTEEQQASKVLLHQLGGHPKVLSTQLSKLTSLEAFRNRFANEQPKAATVDSPLPVLDRPSSQPNHAVHPHPGVFHDPSFHMGPPPPRGHKRQRSRSVPAVLDFGGPRRQPPFLVQHHHVHHHNTVQNISNSQNQIFAPVPQYPHTLPYQQHQASFGTIGPPLQVDPSSGFNFDFNTPAPPSATTGTTPPSSEFEHSLYPPPPYPYEAYSAPQPQMPFGGHFLTPVVDSPIHDPSTSPLGNMGQPLQHLSPGTISPHNPLFRSASADPRVHMAHQDEFFHEYIPFNTDGFANNGKLMGYDDQKLDSGPFADNVNAWQIQDRGTVDALTLDQPLVDSTTKQPLTLPFRSSMPEQPQGPLPRATPTPPPPDDYEFSELVNMTP